MTGSPAPLAQFTLGEVTFEMIGPPSPGLPDVAQIRMAPLVVDVESAEWCRLASGVLLAAAKALEAAKAERDKPALPQRVPVFRPRFADSEPEPVAGFAVSGRPPEGLEALAALVPPREGDPYAHEPGLALDVADVQAHAAAPPVTLPDGFVPAAPDGETVPFDECGERDGNWICNGRAHHGGSIHAALSGNLAVMHSWPSGLDDDREQNLAAFHAAHDEQDAAEQAQAGEQG